MNQRICYYCGVPGTSKEHVPPKNLFPEPSDSPSGKNYRKNLITVPSCDVHNSQKSGDDEYLLYVMTMSLTSNFVAKNQFLSKVMRSTTRKPKLIERILSNQTRVVYGDTESKAAEPTIAIETEHDRVVKIFTHIAKVLYFFETKSVWYGNMSVVIEFTLMLSDVEQNMRNNELTRAADELLKEVPFKGQNPEVFSYQYVLYDGNAIMRMNFYGNSKVLVSFIA